MKTIIITGAQGNLGTAVTQKFIDTGYKVVAIVIDEAGKNLMPVHPNLEVTVCDLTNEDACSSLVQSILATHHKIDGALMLAGGFALGDMAATKMSDISKMVNLNFETAYHLSHFLFPHMVQAGYGRLVYVGARPALLADAGKDMIAYGLSKSLVFKLADYINAATKGTNVTATVIVPSTIDTHMNRTSMPDANPDNWVKPEQIADVLEFICSSKGDVLREPVYKVYNNA